MTTLIIAAVVAIIAWKMKMKKTAQVIGVLIATVLALTGALLLGIATDQGGVQAERGLLLWDKTEALMQEYRVDPPASCLDARTDAARLRAILRRYGWHYDAVKALAASGLRCSHDLAKIEPPL